MKYLLSGEQMKMVDNYSINEVGIPSVVLMERAALAVTDCIYQQISLNGVDMETDKRLSNITVVCVCGNGNNGADGLAVARQLNEKGISVEVVFAGTCEHTGTVEFELQKKILHNIGVKVRNNVHFSEYTFIVDAIFGIGLSRNVTGAYAELIDQINESRKENIHQKVIAIDVPSGIHASQGIVMEHAVRADITVTFGYKKMGMVFYPGAEYAGKVVVSDIGFASLPEETSRDYAFTYTQEDIKKIPERNADSNKGTYGKVLIIAGSETMGGAACLSAGAAYRSGCGLVKVLTHENNRSALLVHVPEAVLSVYNDQTEIEELIEKEMAWATCVVIGPGLAMTAQSKHLMHAFLNQMDKMQDVKAVIDADALNILAADRDATRQLKQLTKEPVIGMKRIIITPHMGEMSRLTGVAIDQLKMERILYAETLAKEYGVICVLKDTRTIVADGKNVYINTSGNCGMATAGAGDVLTGIMAGMLITQMDVFTSACMAVYVHGKAGDEVADYFGMRGMKAGDIIERIPTVLNNKHRHFEKMQYNIECL